MHTVVETPRFAADASRLFTDDEREKIIELVAIDPYCGVVVPGGESIRKVRISFGGRGKRGGARVMYIFGGNDVPVFLLAAFAKNEKDDLSRGELMAMAKAVKVILGDYRRTR
jgi:hypothetical protein